MKKKMMTTLAAASTAVLSAALLTNYSKSGPSPEGGDKEDNKLNVHSRGEYIDEDIITQFEDETSIQVVYDVFETNEETYPVTEVGAVKYDVVCPSNYMIQRMIENSPLAGLSFDNIPNYKEIGQQYLDISKGFDPENKYSVPYCWGTVGILYNIKRLEELGVPASTKWSDLWGERSSGETFMQNSVRDASTVALKMKGYSLNNTNSDEPVQTRDLLIEQKLLVQAYVIDQVRDKMIGGEAAVGVIYSGEMLYIQNAVAEQDLDYSLEYVIPGEGTNYWVDSWVVPANTERKENTEKWTDSLCHPDIAKKNFEYITYATPNTGAYDLLGDGPKNSKALFPDLDKLPNCEIIQHLGDDVDTIHSNMQKEIKSEQSAPL